MNSGRPGPSALAASLLALATVAAAAEIPSARSGTEAIFGTGNVNTVAGNRSMAAGFSPEGELTVLKWPSPSYFDQVSYLTPFLPLTDTTALRASPRNGASETDGLHWGIAIETETGAELHWLRDDPWLHEQRYAGPSSGLVVTVAEHEGLGLRATMIDGVLPNDTGPFSRDDMRTSVLLRHLRIEAMTPDAPTRVRVVLYENLAPCRRRLPMLPWLDHLGDAENDFAVLWSQRQNALVHFNPQQKDLGRLLAEPHDTAAEVDALVERLDALFPSDDPSAEPGVFLAVGLSGGQLDWQNGTVGKEMPLDAFEDARDDATLSGSLLATGSVNGAIGTDWLELGPDAPARVTAHVSAGASATEALQALAAARTQGLDASLDRIDRWWTEFVEAIGLPAPRFPDPMDNARAVDVSRRALMNVWVAMDKVTEAIVASITTQSPYGLDWPRDGAFFNHALDQAGLHDVVRRRNLKFYAPLARKPGELDYADFGSIELSLDLAGTHAMNYYADGLVGGPFFFEIDNTALLVWSAWDHYLFTRDADYLEQVFPTMATGARSLALCRDASNGLHCPAFEDDNPALTQTLHGATTVYGAIRSARDAARELARLGRLPAELDHRALWSERLAELERAMRETVLDEDLTEGGATAFQNGLGQRAWNLWPTEFPFTAAEREREAQKLIDGLAPHLSFETDGTGYLAKATLALAKLDWQGQATGRPGFDLREAQRRLMVDVPVQGTDQYGEVFVALDTDGDGVRDFYDNRTAVPHVWAATLQYSALMTMYPPGDPEQVSPTPPAPARRGGSGGCALSESTQSPTAALPYLALLLLLRSTGSRRSTPAHASDAESDAGPATARCGGCCRRVRSRGYRRR